tara:strand:+ start:219 stop:425 length:207 start_codon:yes stop_codon:yes gene_type:complete
MRVFLSRGLLGLRDVVFGCADSVESVGAAFLIVGFVVCPVALMFYEAKRGQQYGKRRANPFQHRALPA